MAEEGGKNNEYEARLKKELSGLTSPTDEELGKVRKVFETWEVMRPDGETGNWKSLISAPPKPSIISSSISLINLGVTGAEVNATGVFVNIGGCLLMADGVAVLGFIKDNMVSEKINEIMGNVLDVRLNDVNGNEVTGNNLVNQQLVREETRTLNVSCQIVNNRQ